MIPVSELLMTDSGGSLTGGSQTLSSMPWGAKLPLLVTVLLLCPFGPCTKVARAQESGPDQRLMTRFSSAEVEWLRRHPVIRYSADPAWPPFSIRRGDTLEGIDPDYLRSIASKLRVRFEYVPTQSWEETLQKLRRGEIDLVTGIADLPERPLDLLYTGPYTRFPVALIMRNDGPFLTSLRQIESRGLKMAGPEGYASTIFLRENHPMIELRPVKSSAEALQLLSRGEVDAVMENLGVAAHQIRTHGLANLKIAGSVPEELDPAMAVRKDSPELRSILDAAISDLGEDEHHSILEPWILIEVAGLWRDRSVRLLGLGLIAVFGSGLLFALLKIQSLRRELRTRHLEEQLLRRSEERSRRFYDALDGPAFLTQPDGRIEFLSERAAGLLKIGSRQVSGRLNLRTFLKRGGDYDDLVAELRVSRTLRERRIEFIDAEGGSLACLCGLRLLTDREGTEIGIEWTGTCGIEGCETAAETPPPAS